MNDFTIVIGKERLLIDLLMLCNHDMQEINRQLQTGIVLCGMMEGKCIAACIAERKSESYEITSWVVDPEYRGNKYGKTLLFYAFDYLKALGGQSIDITGSNSDVNAFVTLQRLGFRIIGVLRNYFKNDGTGAENGIFRRDLLRYRFIL